MKRKIIQIANSTYLVSLPKKWCISNNIKKGDEIDVKEEGNHIIVSTEGRKAEVSIEIDLTDLDRTSLLYIIRALYKKGYDEIKINFNNPTTIHFRKNKKLNVITLIHDEATRLPGMEVIQQKENYCILKAISDTSSSDLDVILNRIFGLFLDAYSDLLEGAANNNRTLLETLKEKHDTITKFLNYSRRFLNKNPEKKTYYLSNTLTQLDNIIDIINISARNFIGFNKKISEKTLGLLKKMKRIFELSMSLFRKFDKKNLIELSKCKVEIDKNISKIGKTIPYDELNLLLTMKSSLKILQCLTEDILMKHY